MNFVICLTFYLTSIKIESNNPTQVIFLLHLLENISSFRAYFTNSCFVSSFKSLSTNYHLSGFLIHSFIHSFFFLSDRFFYHESFFLFFVFCLFNYLDPTSLNNWKLLDLFRRVWYRLIHLSVQMALPFLPTLGKVFFIQAC